MAFSLVPDYMFEKFDMATADFLTKIGVRGIILDIDNTLEPYENPTPGDHVYKWFSELESKGIKAAFVSNNNSCRVSLFNEKLGFPAYPKGGKPFPKNLFRAMADMGCDKSETILMGDQIFTDVWAARNAGIRAILVPPINDKRDPFTRFKRLLERGIINKYEKRKI